MIPAETNERRSSTKAKLLERLHDPVTLRLFVMSTVLLIGYVTIYLQMSDRIAATKRKLKRDDHLIELAVRMEKLQEQYRTFEARVPQQTDGKEWVQYVLEGIRRFPLTLTKLDCREPKVVGPYRAIVLQIELEGSFLDMDKFLRWLESNERLMRADEMTIAPAGESGDSMTMRLTVLGLTG
jgi:Tfp pilus assembly protein PilO